VFIELRGIDWKSKCTLSERMFIFRGLKKSTKSESAPHVHESREAEGMKIGDYWSRNWLDVNHSLECIQTEVK
jgi:hypothetical protein